MELRRIFLQDVYDWTSDEPNGDVVMLPEDISCAPALAMSEMTPRHPLTHPLMFEPEVDKCSLCQRAVSAIKGGLCSVGGERACQRWPTIAPFCGVITDVVCEACSGGNCAAKACKMTRLC